jgi:ankyrin repeat protein
MEIFMTELLLPEGERGSEFGSDTDYNLVKACEHEKIKMARALFRGDPKSAGQVTKFGDTPLIWVCANNMDIDFGRQLIQSRKANPSQVNCLGNTALTIACSRGSPLTMEILNQMTWISRLQFSISKCLRQANQTGRTALIYAIIHDMRDVVDRILAIDPGTASHQDKYDRNTPLHYACYFGREEIGLSLLRIPNYACRPETLNKSGITALMIAIGRNLKILAPAIFATGRSNPAIIDPIYQRTALIMATDRNMTRLAIDLIRSNQTHHNHIDRAGNSAYSLAKVMGKESIIAEILNRGINDL